MTDKELADKIVAFDVSYQDHLGRYWVNGMKYQPHESRLFVRDWRVVGALMEKCQKIYVEYIDELEQTVYARAENNRTWDWIQNEESLPRAIIEACVEALGEKK